MSLYRTWRPRTFSELVGQDAVVRTLTSALDGGKLAHAYLFSGPRGSGKTSAAKILARCINCVNGPISTPDNTCENCLAILSGTALDVLEIDAASNRGIDEIRALREAVKFAPSSMQMKVYIVDEAHMLTKEGANAFLKTLEEPPPHAVFILATTEPEKLPVTILSRCQRYAFRRIAIPVMIGRMREIAAAEGLSIDEPALAAIAYRADGGLRDALTMLEQAAAFSDGAITLRTIDLAFGATGRNYAGTLMDSIIASDAPEVLRAIDDASDAGADMAVLIRSLIAELRNALIGRIDPVLLSRDVAPEDARRAVEWGGRLGQAQIVRALRLLSEALATSRASGNPRLELETALLRFVFSPEDPTIDSLSSRISALESASAPQVAGGTGSSERERPKAPKAAPPARPGSEPDSRSSEITIQRVKAAWSAIRTRVEGERQSLRTQLSRAAPESIEGDTVVIKLPNSVLADTLKENAKLVEAAIEEVLGVPLKAKFMVDGNARRVRSGSATAGASSRAQDSDDPDELFTYLNERIK